MGRIISQNQKSTQHLLSRCDVKNETVSSDAKGPGLLDEDFLLEGTSLGIASFWKAPVAQPVRHLRSLSKNMIRCS